jgi:hypothetical protein
MSALNKCYGETFFLRAPLRDMQSSRVATACRGAFFQKQKQQHSLCSHPVYSPSECLRGASQNPGQMKTARGKLYRERNGKRPGGEPFISVKSAAIFQIDLGAIPPVATQNNHSQAGAGMKQAGAGTKQARAGTKQAGAGMKQARAGQTIYGEEKLGQDRLLCRYRHTTSA